MGQNDDGKFDRSTQVNFPTPEERTHYNGIIVRRHPHPHHHPYQLRRNHTSLTLSPIQRMPTKSPRPKSVNLSAEVFHKGRFVYRRSESPLGRDSVALDMDHLNNYNIKDKTPPIGIVTSYSNSTIQKGSCQNKSLDNNKVRQHSSFQNMRENSARCRCWEFEKDGSAESLHESVAPSPTPEGLSWRRLHMSRAKLKATATTSELLSGFAMVAMVELQINEDTLVPDWLFVMFAVCTTVLVAVHIFALMISTYILPNIEAIAKLDVCEIVNESPHERMRNFIELAWVFSTVLGLFLFLVEVSILCWVKFWDTSFTAAIAATIVVIPVLVIFVLFAIHFYHSLVVHRYDTSKGNMEKLENLKKHLDLVDTSPV